MNDTFEWCLLSFPLQVLHQLADFNCLLLFVIVSFISTVLRCFFIIIILNDFFIFFVLQFNYLVFFLSLLIGSLCNWTVHACVHVIKRRSLPLTINIITQIATHRAQIVLILQISPSLKIKCFLQKSHQRVEHLREFGVDCWVLFFQLMKWFKKVFYYL